MRDPRRPGIMRASGFSLIDVVFASTCLVVLCALVIPSTASTVKRARGLAAARYLAARVAVLRGQAISRSASMALRFHEDAAGVSFDVVLDGNRNGVRTREIDLGIDRPIEPAVKLSDLFSGAEIAVIPQLGNVDAVQLGGGSLLSFTPDGTSSSGSVYIRGSDGTQWVVRVLGVTARARVLRFEPTTGEWRHAF